ncbi:MAG: EAL domain-containing protein [Butyrivibrio sp.]|nr:EAL domain-containing protein [Butyrivibrio sp.]
MEFAYQFDVAGILVILTSLVCAWVRPKLLDNFTTNLKLLIVLSIAYVLTDGSTSILLQLKDPRLYYFTYGLLILYFSVLFLFPFRATMYFYELCGEKPKEILLRGSLFVMLSLATFGNIFFDFFFSLDRETFNYLPGVGAWTTFVYYFLCAVLVGVCAMKHRRYLGKIRLRLLITIFFITVFTIIYQNLIPQQSITGLIISLSVAMTIVVFCFIDVTVDELTGINNKVGFTRACDEIMHNSDVSGYSMIKIQIYHMQELNERTGMENGDRLLMLLADTIRKSCANTKSKSVYGRIGGDTFGIFTRDEIEINALSEALSGDHIQNPVTGLDYAVSFYAGIYRLEDKEMDIESMLDHASYALKWVSGNFKTNVAFYDDDIRQEDEHRKAVERKVRSAIIDKEFKVYLQPVYDTMTRERVSAEALVRWIDKKNQMINPGDFIPILEKNGFVTELDLYILEEVCKMLSEWKERGFNIVPVSVNFSRVDVNYPGLVDEITEIVDRYGLDHSLIKIELTESAFNGDMESIIKVLNQLHEKGFIIMMDDFGSGYSNLNMFKDMPVDVVKIDMYFLRNIENNEKGMIVLESVVQMAKRLGLAIVVEGVETQKQYDYIRKLRCEMIQGFYFAKPMPSDVFPDQITAG